MRLATVSRRSLSTVSTSSAPPLFTGVASTDFVHATEWKRDVGGFRVLRHLGPSGELVDGVDGLPFDGVVAREIYRTMVRSAVYDEMLLQMQRQGRIAFYCANFGEEATSTASAAALAPQDMVWPHYRELGMFLWRGLTAQQIVDQNMGNEGDGSKGRNLQVHYCLPDENVQSVHAVLGTHIPQAPGAGYAYSLDKEDRVSVAYFGDGAASEGDALVALNFAAVFKSQTIFICRNNGYSISTPVSEQYGGDGIAARGAAFGIPTMCVALSAPSTVTFRASRSHKLACSPSHMRRAQARRRQRRRGGVRSDAGRASARRERGHARRPRVDDVSRRRPHHVG